MPWGFSGHRVTVRSMKAIEITRQGTPVADNLELNIDRPRPELPEGSVLVRTEASGLNQLDLWVGRGVPGYDVQYPAVPGSDGVGIVEEVGTGVSAAWIGRRVILNAAVELDQAIEPGVLPVPPMIQMIGEHVQGTLAEYFVAPVGNVLQLGDEVDPVQAAAFGLAHLTAWRMLVTRAGLKAGSTVLVTGVGGGVAQALLGIAKLFSCRTIVTSRSREKLDRALELGADEAVLDEGADFSREVRALTAKRGVDVCADSVGEAIHLSCIKSLARGGTFVTCGCTSGPRAGTDLARVFWNELTIIGSTMGTMAEFQQVLSHLGTGRLTAVVDSTFSPEDARDAFSRLESASQFGKIVIDWRS